MLRPWRHMERELNMLLMIENQHARSYMFALVRP